MSTCARVYNLPGLPGADGADGADGASGSSALTTLTAAFTIPAVGASAVATVADTSWIVPSYDIGLPGEVNGHVLVLEFGGSFLAESVVDATHVSLYNLGYPYNAAPATVVPTGARLAPGGPQGSAGTVPGGALLVANNLNDLASVIGARANLGLGALAVASTVDDSVWAGTVLALAHGGTGAATAAGARTALGLGSMAVQGSTAVSITGGTIAGTPISGSTGSFTNVAVSAQAITAGVTAYPPSALQTLAAANTIAVAASKVRVAGNGGAVILTSTPSVSNAVVSDGQELLIQGTDDTNTVALQDEGSLAGSGLRLGAASRVLGEGDTLRLSWDATLAVWVEVSFTNVV